MDKHSIKEIEEMLIGEVSVILNTDAKSVKADIPLHTLGMDSLGFVELLVAIERIFDLKLVESNLTKEDFQTIGSLASRISSMD